MRRARKPGSSYSGRSVKVPERVQERFQQRFLSAPRGNPPVWVFRTSVQYGESKCVLWPKGVNGSGYGQMGFGVNGRRYQIGAHVMAWRMAHNYKPFPEHLEVLHLCGEQTCINPNHITAGTHEENIRHRELIARLSQAGIRTLQAIVDSLEDFLGVIHST